MTRTIKASFVRMVPVSIGVFSLGLMANAVEPLDRPAAAPRVVVEPNTYDKDTPHEILTAESFVSRAIAGGRREIKLAELATRKTQNADLKQFAQTLVQDHSKLNQQLEELAARNRWEIPAVDAAETSGAAKSASDGVKSDAYASPRGDQARKSKDSGTPPTGKDPADRYKTDTVGSDAKDAKPSVAARLALKDLENLSGPEFDRAFLKEMVRDHDKCVTKFENASLKLTDEELKRIIADTLPALKQHQSTARRLARENGVELSQIESRDADPAAGIRR